MSSNVGEEEEETRRGVRGESGRSPLEDRLVRLEKRIARLGREIRRTEDDRK